MNDKIAKQILDAAKKDQELRFQVHDTNNIAELWKEIEVVDKQTTQMMKDIVAKIGWPTISKVGSKASHAAWLLVQHADKDPKFQKQCLSMMQREDKDEVKQANIALLTDRVRQHEGLPQLYGTQFMPSKNKTNYYEPYKIEDVENVDARRKAMGLNTLEENSAEINELKPEGTKQSSLE